MFYLIAVILLNVFLFTLFKLFPKYGVNNLQAIVVNYWVCVVTGSLYLGHLPISAKSVEEPWWGWVLFLGVLFISMFNLLAYSTKKEGITTTIISNKLSLVIPVIISIVLYNESVTALKIVGVLLAIPGIYLTVKKKGERIGLSKSFVLPLSIFFLSGALDTIMKYMEHTYLSHASIQASFTIHIFFMAAMLGSVAVVYNVVTGRTKLSYKNVLAGIVLGVPNFFSIFYLVRLFNVDVLESSAIIPVNNIAILLLSTIIAIIFFKEEFTKYRFVGILLSALSILLIVLSNTYG
ncbi:MAG: EamA family transporter [Flavipsychrobacter sp.]